MPPDETCGCFSVIACTRLIIIHAQNDRAASRELHRTLDRFSRRSSQLQLGG